MSSEFWIAVYYPKEISENQRSKFMMDAFLYFLKRRKDMVIFHLDMDNRGSLAMDIFKEA